MAANLALANRIERVRLDSPTVQRGEVEQALWHHLSAVGAETDDFRWVDDLEEGFRRVRYELLREHIVWTPSGSPQSWSRFSLWAPDAPVSYPDRQLPHREDPFVAPAVRVARASLGRRWNVHRTSRSYNRWRESYRDVADPVSVHRLALAAADEQAIVAAGMPTREPFEQREKGHDSFRDVRIASRLREAVRTYESARFRAPVLEPFVRAWVNGLFCFWVLESKSWRQRECVLVPRPALHVADGRMHRPDGPAVEWPSGLSYWFWEGLHIPRRAAAKSSEQARLQVLARTPNLERRRLLLDRIGYDRFLEITDAQLLQQDDYGKLWKTSLSVDEEQLRVVEVNNSTPEPDGSRRRYFLRVPPNARTARQAVAWTFGFNDAHDYEVAAES